MILNHNHSEGFDAFKTKRLVFQEAPKAPETEGAKTEKPETAVGTSAEAMAGEAKAEGAAMMKQTEQATERAHEAIKEKKGKVDMAGLRALNEATKGIAGPSARADEGRVLGIRASKMSAREREDLKDRYNAAMKKKLAEDAEKGGQ
jgi:hypothetical protein